MRFKNGHIETVEGIPYIHFDGKWFKLEEYINYLTSPSA